MHVEFAFPEERPSEKLHLSSVFRDSYLSFLPITGSVIVTNTGQGLIQPQQMVVTSSTLFPNEQKIDVPPVPPYGSVTLPVTFRRQPVLTNGIRDLTIQVAGITHHESLSVMPVIMPAAPVLGGLFIGSSVIIIFIIAIKSGRIPFPRRKK